MVELKDKQRHPLGRRQSKKITFSDYFPQKPPEAKRGKRERHENIKGQ